MTSQPAIFNSVRRSFREEPKKAGILMFLVVVMVGCWAKYMLGRATDPSEASAVVVTSDSDSNVVHNPNTAAENLRPVSSAASAPLKEWITVPITPLKRNIFAVQYDYYPQDSASHANSAIAERPSEKIFNTEAKSPPIQADQQKERQALIQSVQLQASRLRLQTIVMGTAPQALINGALVSQGDIVASFRVLRIEARRIIVEREGIRLEILMK